MNFLIHIINLLRPKQWVKNLLVFAALIFSKHLLDLPLLWRSSLTFVAFCALSSSAYVLNDLFDLKEDRAHPWKRTRPIASGAVSISFAIILCNTLMIVSLLIAYLLNLKLLIIFLIYFLLQLVYSFGLKHVVILDVMLLASGFVIRAIAGGIAISANVSNWLLLCTFLLALFLALCKRRQELVVLEKSAVDHRPVLAEYSEPFIDSLISVITGATVVSYALYTVSSEVIRKLGTDKLIFTLPFVLYGIFRYLYLMHQKDLGDNPTEVLFKDFSLQLGILAWLVVCFILIYFRM